MKEIVYSCDLCGIKYSVSELIGFEFDPMDNLVVKPQHTVERHWCKKCCNAVEFLTNTTSFKNFIRPV